MHNISPTNIHKFEFLQLIVFIEFAPIYVGPVFRSYGDCHRNSAK